MNSKDSPVTALTLLRGALGDKAEFHQDQLESIDSATTPGSRTLVVQRTGWGKSVVYFLATALLRAQGKGPTLLVSPLLALMRNQQDLADKFGVVARSINSTNTEDWNAIEAELKANKLDLLLISPERLANSRFRQQVLGGLEKDLGLLVVDEAHCISDWGHDFRPDYKRIVQTLQRLDSNVPILCTTATANDRVVEDIRGQLGDQLEVKRGPLMRESLRLRVLQLADQSERLAMLARLLSRLRGTGIIYTLTVNDARRVAAWLRKKNFAVEEYYGALPNERRLELESSFNANELKCLVATTALGMGYDKPDVAFVIHYQRPGSIIAYYQQVGRAGRNIDRAEVILFEGAEDDEINEYFIQNAFPPRECFEGILDVLTVAPSTQAQCVQTLNFRDGQIEKALSLLEVQDAIKFVEGRFELLDRAWTYGRLRTEQIGQQRKKEIEQMREFVASQECRMLFLSRALDDPSPEKCGICDRCAPVNPPAADPSDVIEAIEFLRGDVQEVSLRKFYPAGVLGEGRKKIPESSAFLPGATISVYNDAGWGRLVRSGKYGDVGFSQELVEPAEAAIRKLSVQPDWLCWVPSHSRPTLVSHFAQQLARALNIEAIEAIQKSRDNQPQKLMQNSNKQLDNVSNSFAVKEHRPGVCLLVDDIVDSGWTMTVLAIKLVHAGVSGVIPFALATSKPRD
jgi:ATP-dependent DNA helicase RecQ